MIHLYRSTSLILSSFWLVLSLFGIPAEATNPPGSDGGAAIAGAYHTVALYAYRQGLFVLAQSGDNVVILNDAKFQPKAW